MHRPTQTHDDVAADAALTLGRPAARLIRFFRADAPAVDMDEFHLERHAAWTLGRVDSSTAVDAGWETAHVFSRDDALMSGRHARLTRAASSWQIEDTGSKNGTFVNAERIEAPRALRSGDIVECGSSFFVYRESDTEQRVIGSAAPPARDVTLSLPPLHYQIRSVLPFTSSDFSLHLHGETGTGKEVVARAIHDLSGRSGPFVARNCAAIPDTLFESELFGYMKGAFSGASANKRGQVIEAHRGTLFLDEIGELSLPMQAKLLRVIELKEVLPVGATEPIAADFRLISATLCDLREMVAQGRFRKDLYARLGQTFVIPPLRAHVEYIGALMPTLLAETPLPTACTVGQIRFSMAAARALMRYPFPFNIRELKQCVQSALTAAWADRKGASPLSVELSHLPSPLTVPTQGAHASMLQLEPSRRPRPTLDDQAIMSALQSTGGNRAGAARALGVSERTIFRRLRKWRPDEPAS
jgi:transcriptional regulator with PAS, ATPase and Fis domain